ncbi:hypothetical protein [Nonomuraea sp. NEAU-A123]|uniref:hypothetical protein n=1 Tax=Nonomuraea sp. NEAU-A123 TaxID=2839649 RepID=UPI001BE44191|nr:hypothetical protein [Nonomuraea sp. NEAU-A123]MBT2234989.1 hypothetical protein [Nonomuraea sp. NEAU-A123]
MLTQFLALAGVVIGATISYVFAARMDKARNQREMIIRWDVRRYEAFTEYLGAVTQMARVAGQLVRARGWDNLAADVDREAGLMALDGFESARTSTYERVVLLSTQDCIDAADMLNAAVWRLEWIARGAVDGALQDWRAALDSYTASLDRFQQAARACLMLPLATFVRQIKRPSTLTHRDSSPYSTSQPGN